MAKGVQVNRAATALFLVRMGAVYEDFCAKQDAEVLDAVRNTQ